MVNKVATTFTLKMEDREAGVTVKNTFQALGHDCKGED